MSALASEAGSCLPSISTAPAPCQLSMKLAQGCSLPTFLAAQGTGAAASGEGLGAGWGAQPTLHPLQARDGSRKEPLGGGLGSSLPAGIKDSPALRARAFHMDHWGNSLAPQNSFSPLPKQHREFWGGIQQLVSPPGRREHEGAQAGKFCSPNDQKNRWLIKTGAAPLIVAPAPLPSQAHIS